MKCKCYNGPYSSQMPKTLVSVRCPAHTDVLPEQGHSLMLVDETGKMISTTPRDKLKNHETISLRNSKNAKRYGADPHAQGGITV